jgi:hypothetical protein
VQVDLSDECSRYSHYHNLIIIAIAEGNLDDHDILDPSAWPIWKVELDGMRLIVGVTSDFAH